MPLFSLLPTLTPLLAAPLLVIHTSVPSSLIVTLPLASMPRPSSPVAMMVMWVGILLLLMLMSVSALMADASVPVTSMLYVPPWIVRLPSV